MRTNLTVDDLGDLLEQPIVAVLASYRADGSKMLSAVSFEWRDGVFNVRRTAARYYGEDAADDFVAGFKEPGLVIRLRPDRIRAWDFRDEVSASEPGRS